MFRELLKRISVGKRHQKDKENVTKLALSTSGVTKVLTRLEISYMYVCRIFQAVFPPHRLQDTVIDLIGVPCFVSKLGAREGDNPGYLPHVCEVSSQLEVVTKQSKAINNTARCSAILLNDKNTAGRLFPRKTSVNFSKVLFIKQNKLSLLLW